MRVASSIVAAIAVIAASTAFGQDSREALQQRLTTRYTLTHPSGDEHDILKPGIVLVLQKDHLVMVPVSQPDLMPNTYKDGKVGQSRFSKMPGLSKRVFMTTEKMWVTQIEVKDDAVVFNLLSDPVDDVRYKGVLRFPFAKGTVPLFDQVNGQISEVFSTENLPGEAAAPPERQRPAVARKTDAPAAAPPPPLEVPPAPSSPPAAKSVSVGQTTDQVVAMFGQPTKILKPSSSKQIYIYPDMKVTFVNGKVTDFQ